MIANKSDLEDKKVSEEDLKNFKNKTGIDIVETSAKQNYQILQAFEKLTKMLIERADKKVNNEMNSSYKLTPTTPLEGRLKENALKCCK